MAKTKQPAPNLSHIVDQLRPLAFPVDQLVHDPANARIHDETNLAAIQSSLLRFGQDQPLVVQRPGNIVRKGNGRLAVARRLGFTHMACVFVEESEVSAVCRALADNRTAELAAWDQGVLNSLLAAIRDEGESVDGLGWTDEELAAILPPADSGDSVADAFGLDDEEDQDSDHRESVRTYRLRFRSRQQREEWVGLMRELREVMADECPEAKTPADRLIAFLKDHLGI